MRLKSYFAASVEAAMSQAAQELGADAMLVHTRRAAGETRRLGEYEVVFATAQRETGHTPAGNASRSPAARSQTTVPGGSPAGISATQAPAPASLDRLAEEIRNMKRQLERIAGSLPSTAGSAHPPSPWPDLERELIEAEVEPELSRELALRAAQANTEDGRRSDSKLASVASALEGLVKTDATLGVPRAEPRIVALIGPPGAGKTTTLVKLAARFGLAGRRPAQILSTDVFRIAAAEQLRLCAAILGIGFQVAETAKALDQAIEEHRGKELILIDTPGYGAAEFEDGLEMTEFFSARKDIDLHLTLPASMRASDLRRTAGRFEAFGPSKLLFTRLDETDSLGGILNLLCRTGKPVSFLGTGQRIPEDLEPATQKGLAILLLRQAAAPSAEEPDTRRAGQFSAAAA